MGWLGNLRTAGTMTAASALVEKRLQLEVQVGRIRAADAKPLAHGLVTALFQSFPELLESPAKVSPVLLAGAALAKGVKDADALGKPQMSSVLFSALRAVWSLDLLQLDVERMSPSESRLMKLAYSAFEPSPEQAARSELKAAPAPAPTDNAVTGGTPAPRSRVILDPRQQQSHGSPIPDLSAIRPGKD